MVVLLLHGDDERDVPLGRVGGDAPQDLEAGVDPDPVVERTREDAPVRQRLGRPVEHDRVAGPDELERVLAVGGADVDAEPVPRDLALVRRDDDAADLAGAVVIRTR